MKTFSAWDKNLWADIMCYGYVRDLADWFVSDESAHKLGTIYALLHSIMKADKCLYEEIVHNTVGLLKFSLRIYSIRLTVSL